MDSLSTRQSYPGPAAEISIRREAPAALRAADTSVVYQRGLTRSEHRLALCRGFAHRVNDAR